jgi:hypothetical protein
LIAVGVAPELDLSGVDVHQTVTAPTDPTVSHGRFAVRNHGASMRRVAITAVTVIGEALSLPVERFHVYRLPSYDEVDRDVIEIPPHEEVSFEVSFAGRPLAPGLATDVAVAFDVTADGVTEHVVSAWSFTIRTPKR